VLPLSPGPSPPRTFADLILPDPAAFCNIASTSPPSYPLFTAATCSWQVMFTHIKQPQRLWSCWGPKNLGDYLSIKMLWQAWDEGSFVDRVGRQPPLRLIEKQWGHQEDQRTGKGRLQAWRPHKDNTVVSSFACRLPLLIVVLATSHRLAGSGQTSTSLSGTLKLQWPMAKWLLRRFKILNQCVSISQCPFQPCTSHFSQSDRKRGPLQQLPQAHWHHPYNLCLPHLLYKFLLMNTANTSIIITNSLYVLMPIHYSV
jgi:hypothetical protein